MATPTPSLRATLHNCLQIEGSSPVSRKHTLILFVQRQKGKGMRNTSEGDCMGHSTAGIAEREAKEQGRAGREERASGSPGSDPRCLNCPHTPSQFPRKMLLRKSDYLSALGAATRSPHTPPRRHPGWPGSSRVFCSRAGCVCMWAEGRSSFPESAGDSGQWRADGTHTAHAGGLTQGAWGQPAERSCSDRGRQRAWPRPPPRPGYLAAGPSPPPV